MFDFEDSGVWQPMNNMSVDYQSGSTGLASEDEKRGEFLFTDICGRCTFYSKNTDWTKLYYLTTSDLELDTAGSFLKNITAQDTTDTWAKISYKTKFYENLKWQKNSVQI